MPKPNVKRQSAIDTDMYDTFGNMDDPLHDSDEGTDDASEGESASRLEFSSDQTTDVKEQMYKVKLSQLKKQLNQLKDGTLPEYQKKLRKIDTSFQERIRSADVFNEQEERFLEEEHKKEKLLVSKYLDERKVEVKASMISDLEDKKKQIEAERLSMDLNGDSMEVKPINTRKLRRRPNDPVPLPEKRRKASPVSQMNYILLDAEIQDDLNILNKISGKQINQQRRPQVSLPVTTPSNNENIYDVRIDDGRLFHEKKWYSRGQSVYIEGKDIGKVSAVISAVGTAEIWLRRTADNSKVKICVADMKKGKYLIKKRTS